MLDKIKSWFKQRPKNNNQEAKRGQMLAGSIIMVIFFIGFVVFIINKNHQTTGEEISVKEFDGIFDKKFNDSTDEALIEKQNNQIKKLAEGLKSETKSHKDELLKEKSRVDESNQKLVSTVTELTTRLNHLEKENLKAKNKIASLEVSNRNIPPNREEQQARKYGQQALYSQSRFQRAPLKHVRKRKPPQRKKVKTPENYVWAGTSVEGVLTTGILGDAGINGSKNTGSGIIRLIDDGRMPNYKKSHLKDCIITYSSYGDLSGGSAVLHTDRLSCAGKVMSFEKTVFGSVFDSDAMQDLRGTPILQSKPLLGYSSLAGILAGVGDGLKNAGNVQALNANGTIASFNSTSLAQQAIGGGLSNPANKISEYIMKIADIYHPLVVVKPGRVVTVVFLKGFWTEDEPEPDTKTKQSKPYRRVASHSIDSEKSASVLEKESLDKLLKANPSLNQPLFKGYGQ